MDFRKGTILVIVDEMYNFLKRLVIGREMKVDWMVKVFAWVCPSVSKRLLRPSFVKRQASSPSSTFFDNIQIINVIWPVNYILNLKFLNPYSSQKELFH